jgi:exopolysaccharide production protein ExoQ
MHASGQAGTSGPAMDKCGLMPLVACVFASIASPLLILIFMPHTATLASIMEARPENRIFWPIMTAISLALAARNRSRLAALEWPPHIICLLAFLALAGTSVFWAFKPELAFTRIALETMVVVSIVLPAMLAAPSVDIMLGLFLTFAFASVLNLYFVLDGSQVTATYGAATVEIGYAGYFTGKNLLGEFSVVTLLLSLHEALQPRLWRRACGIVFSATAVALVIWSNSKTAFGLVILAPIVALVMLKIRKLTRISPAILILVIPLCYLVLSHVIGLNINRISYILYGDSTLTGRTIIWDFSESEIARRPLLGWGYKSFWLAGSDAPSITDAPGWVKAMPNAHNGYYDMTLEMGYVGLAFLVAFLLTTLHAIGRMADRDPGRARLVLSLVLFIIFYNFLESLWLRAFDLLWVVFVILVAEIGRYWQRAPLTSAWAAEPKPQAVPWRFPTRWARTPPRLGYSSGHSATVGAANAICRD